MSANTDQLNTEAVVADYVDTIAAEHGFAYAAGALQASLREAVDMLPVRARRRFLVDLEQYAAQFKR